MSNTERRYEYITDFVRVLKEIPSLAASQENIGGIHTPAIPQEKQESYIQMANAVSETCVDLMRFVRDIRIKISDSERLDGILENALYRFTANTHYSDRDYDELLAFAGSPRSTSISTGSNKVDISRINPFDAGQNFDIELNHLYAFYRRVDPITLKFYWVCNELNIKSYLNDPDYLYERGIIVHRYRPADAVYLLYRTNNPKADGYALICKVSDELDGFISAVEELNNELLMQNIAAEPDDMEKKEEGEDSV